MTLLAKYKGIFVILPFFIYPLVLNLTARLGLCFSIKVLKLVAFLVFDDLTSRYQDNPLLI